MTRGWRALHIFHAGDLDRLLVDMIAPVMRRLREDAAIERFFFLRYWNGGPHIRLRCLLNRADDVHPLKEEIESWLEARPAPDPDRDAYEAGARQIQAIETRLGADAVGAAEPLEPLRPTNAVELRPYRFDARRYGRDNREDTHDHAWVSSKIALTALQSLARIPERRAGLALQAGALVATRLGVSSARAADCFEEMSRWNRLSPTSPDDDDYWGARGFEVYAAQGPGLDAARALLANDRWSSPGPDRVLLLDAWRCEVDRRADCLRQAARRGSLPGEPAYLMLDGLHLFCNRLGVGLDAECYLYYLLANLLRAGTRDAQAVSSEAWQ